MRTVLTGLVLGSALLSTNVIAEEAAGSTTVSDAASNFYIGLDIFGSNNTFTYESSGFPDRDIDNDSKGMKFKVGTKFAGTWRVQGYYQYESYDDTIYDKTNDQLDELGVDVIKAFTLKSKFSPFIQAGLGYGSINIDGYDQSDANATSLKIGGGTFYKFNKNFEGVAGLDLQARNWSDIKINNTTFDSSERSVRYYIGANYFF